MGVKEFMDIEISREYNHKVYKLFNQNKIEKDRNLLRRVIQRFVLFLKLSRFVIDKKNFTVYSIDHKLKHFLHRVGKKNDVITMFIHWYKTSWLDYETSFEPKYEYLRLNLNLFLHHNVLHVPVVSISPNYVHFFDGLHDTNVQQFYPLNDIKIKNIYTTHKIERKY